MTQREIYLSIKRDLRRLNMRLIMSRLKDIAIGLIAGAIYAIACGWLYFVTVMAR